MMNYRRLGRTDLMVSEIGLGGDWFERHSYEECKAIIDRAEELGVNIIDCLMPNPDTRSNIGKILSGRRERWIIQGHIGCTWQNGQYVRTRDVEKCDEAFEDLLTRLQTEYIDLGLVHFIDQESDWNDIWDGPYIQYVKKLKASGKIKHIGIDTHNPEIALKAVESGLFEMIMFSINPAFDLLPPTEDLESYGADEYQADLNSIDPVRTKLYWLCEQNEVGITVMKPYAGGRLFDENRSPFGVSLTPVQCIHYCLTRPAVAAVMVGCDTPEHVEQAVAYEIATQDEKDYAGILANAPRHSFAQGECTYCGHCKPCPAEIDIAMVNKYYDLAAMQPLIPVTVWAHYYALEHKADECIGCKSCENRCPFGIKIADRMVKTAKLFRD